MVPLKLAVLPFLAEVCLRIRNRRLGGRAVGSRGFSRFYRVSHGDEVDVHCAQFFVNSSLAPWYSFVGVLSLLQMCLKVSGVGAFLSFVGMLFWVIGRLSVVMVRVVLSLHFIPGKVDSSGFAWFLQVVFYSPALLNDFLKQVVVSRRDVGICKWVNWLREDLGF